jgi:hypothetical protein
MQRGHNHLPPSRHDHSPAALAYLNPSIESPFLPAPPCSPRLRTFSVRPRSIRLCRQPLPPAASLLDPATNNAHRPGKIASRSNDCPRLPVSLFRPPDSASAENLIAPWSFPAHGGSLSPPCGRLLPQASPTWAGGRSRTVPTLLSNHPCPRHIAPTLLILLLTKRGRWTLHDTAPLPFDQSSSSAQR